MGALPNLVVIGAMKCGTSALHSYLALHPDISMSTRKELDFFVDGEIVQSADCVFDDEDLRVERTAEHNWSRGRKWYERQFSDGAPVRGESSPSYTAPWHPQVAERMAATLESPKLVFLVRDPLERSISNFEHQRALGRERRTIDQALRNFRGPYVARSRYGLAIAPFLEHFPRASLLVLTQEELLNRRRETVRAVYRFAGVDDSFWSPMAERERYGGEAKGGRARVLRRIAGRPGAAVARRLPDGVKWRLERLLSSRAPAERQALDRMLRAELAAYLREDVERFGAAVGREFPDWSLGARSGHGGAP